MKIKCKIENAECPNDLDICCGTCGFKDNCGNRCEACGGDIQNCPDAEVITDELTQFRHSVPGVIQKITDLIQQKKELEDQEKKLTAELLKAMEAFGVKSFESDLIKMTYVAPSTRSGLDSAKLKKDHPDIVAQYTKVSDVAAFVKVELKGGGK